MGCTTHKNPPRFRICRESHDHNTAVAFVKDRKWKSIAREIKSWQPQEVAELFRHAKTRHAEHLFSALPEAQRVQVFAHLDTSIQHRLLHKLSRKEDTYLLKHLTPDDRAHLLGTLPVWQRGKFLKLLDQDSADQTRELLTYPDESVGRFMTPHFVAIKQSWTIRKALSHLRTVGKNSETMHVVYITDKQGKLVDDMRLRTLILSEPQKKLSDVMDRSFIALNAYDDREEAVRIMRRYDLFSLPVIDEQGTLVGIVTADDVLDVQEAEATEDFHKGASISPLKNTYRQTSIFSLYQRRIWWLALLVGINLI